ncbi:MAG: hypothetical protein JWN31_1487 [Frankiales bacterium]|nr:hypothetical protein [Frankiales bacterium]
MSPLDDELHDALHNQAATIDPPADPMAGIERRARGLHRRRLAATIAGGAVVVAAVAFTVPALIPDSTAPSPGPFATGGPATLDPAPTPTATATATASQSGPPANVLTSWPQRGVSTRGPKQADLLLAFADAMGRSADVGKARYRELFLGDTGKGEGFTVGQAWFEGDTKAYGVSYTINVSPDGTSAFFIGPPTPANPTVLAFSVPNLAGMSDLLVVVPQPNTGQVLYDDGAGAFRPITGQDQRDGVVLIDRSVNATNDRLELLDGNGDMGHPTFEGPVAPLLCGIKECG